MFKILIVEDNMHFRQTLRDLLTIRFPEILFDEAINNNEAVQKINTFVPDLVFMDIKIPGGNGLEITRKIRESKSKSTVIILTNNDQVEYREAAKRIGADYFLSKVSTSPEEIFSLVKKEFSKMRPK
jgi:DNA-binding NarL/FixJ family response regulator